MTTDYESLRTANRERYGWDTAHIELLGSLYSERTHFIFELIQNAEDADATTLTFDLRDDRLEVRHDGRPFTEDDVTSLCQLAHSSKSGDLTIASNDPGAAVKTVALRGAQAAPALELFRGAAVLPVVPLLNVLPLFPVPLFVTHVDEFTLDCT